METQTKKFWDKVKSFTWNSGTVGDFVTVFLFFVIAFLDMDFFPFEIKKEKFYNGVYSSSLAETKLHTALKVKLQLTDGCEWVK